MRRLCSLSILAILIGSIIMSMPLGVSAYSQTFDMETGNISDWNPLKSGGAIIEFSTSIKHSGSRSLRIYTPTDADYGRVERSIYVDTKKIHVLVWWYPIGQFKGGHLFVLSQSYWFTISIGYHNSYGTWYLLNTDDNGITWYNLANAVFNQNAWNKIELWVDLNPQVKYGILVINGIIVFDKQLRGNVLTNKPIKLWFGDADGVNCNGDYYWDDITIEDYTEIPFLKTKTAIVEAYNYVDKLYQSINSYAVVKEYPSSPIDIYDIYANKWTLVGQDSYPDIIIENSITANSECLRYAFWEYGTGIDNSPNLLVNRYYYSDGRTKYEITLVEYKGNSEVNIYLYNTLLWSNVNKYTSVPQTKIVWTDYWGIIPAFRYTTRHGSQISSNMYKVWGTRDNGYYLDKLLNDYGFTYDIYDACWKMSNDYPDGYMFSTESYHDIDVYSILPRGSYYYPYKSNVGINRDLYIIESSNDPLLKTIWVIHHLNKYGQPDTKYFYFGDPSSPSSYWTPREMIRHVENNYWDGHGIKYMDTFYYGVRLTTFLIAETLLGYKYGDSISKAKSDRASEVLQMIQIGSNGYFETEDYGIVLRPQHRGGFFVGYVIGSSYAFRTPKMSELAKAVFDIVKILLGWTDMKSETKGLIPTNLETTCLGVQALRVYLYYKYGVAYPNSLYIP